MASRARLSALQQLRCSIFQTSFNPTSARTGAKYLRARLRGPSMIQYYPAPVSFGKVQRRLRVLQLQSGLAQADDPESGYPLVDFVEGERLEDIEKRKARGKGPPKKAKSKEESRRAAKKQKSKPKKEKKPA